MKHKIITINQTTKAWSRIKGLNRKLEKAAAATLAHLPKSLQFPVAVTLLLTTDAAIRRLNHDFRGMDKATNVLSFPQFTVQELKKLSRRRTGLIPLPLVGGVRGGLKNASAVLNFTSPPFIPPASGGESPAAISALELGDIAIAYQYMVVEAKKDHKILIDHVTHLFIHGFLHLFGYDHIKNAEAESMERLETKIMAALDLPDPHATAHDREPKRRRTTDKDRSPKVRPKT